MEFKLHEKETINILRVLISEYSNAKTYFNQCVKKEDLEGVTSPEEIKNVYNKILKQAQDQGSLRYLEPIVK